MRPRAAGTVALARQHRVIDDAPPAGNFYPGGTKSKTLSLGTLGELRIDRCEGDGKLIGHNELCDLSGATHMDHAVPRSKAWL